MGKGEIVTISHRYNFKCEICISDLNVNGYSF